MSVSPRVRPTHPLVALSSAAVIAVYSAGYLKTRAAAATFSDAPAMPRPALIAAAAPTAAPPTRLPDVTPVAVSAPRHRKPPASVNPSASIEPSVDVATAATATSTPIETHDAAASVVVITPEHAVVEATSIAPAPAPPEPARPAYHDGTFSGWGSSRHGDIQATVVIENGRIASARISECDMHYPCSWIAHLQGQVVARQSPDVDYVSGATQSANAFYYAVVEALTKAAK